VSRTVRSSQPASEEFAAAVRWYEEQRAGLGAEFYEAVSKTIAIIEARPEIGNPLRQNPVIRRMLVQRFPYQVVYRISPTEVVIVAVAHLKRRPGYWKGR
jgi:plasmid stabilization system protein ParE